MKIFALLLLGLMMSGCKKDEPVAVAPVVVAAPKVTEETRQKGEDFFLLLNKVEMKLLTANLDDLLQAVLGVKPELEVLERALLHDLPEENHEQWEKIKVMICDLLLADLAYVKLRNEERKDDWIAGFQLRADCPRDMFSKLKGEDGLYQISVNKKILMQEITALRTETLAAWDALVK